MEGFAIFFSSIKDIFSNPYWLVLMLAFTAIGVLLGAMPGISVNMSLILALPLTYSMDTRTAMCVLLACYIGAMSGGLISAITLNVPGTGASLATTFDGYPLAEKGRATEAVGVGILTSFVGGAISFLLLILIAPLMARVALKFGPWEYFAIGIFSITMILSVSGNDIVKGVLAAAFGMCLAMTGADPIGGVIRFNFGNHKLDGGITTVALMCGMFAVPEVLNLAANREDRAARVAQMSSMKGFGITFRGYLKYWKTILASALIGSYGGLLPGVGGASSSLLAYMTIKNNSKNPERFGTGDIEGIIASETANNACIGGAMIPMLALGIPGSSTAAIVMGALTLHGIQCGPLVFQSEVKLVYLIFAILFVANIFMLIVERGCLKGYIKILTAPRRIVMVVVMMMCFLGSYSARNNYIDVFVFAIGGVIGYFLNNAGIPRSPIVLGYILTGIIEENLVRALSISRGQFGAILTRPIALVFLAIAAWSIFSQLRKYFKAKKSSQLEETRE